MAPPVSSRRFVLVLIAAALLVLPVIAEGAPYPENLSGPAPESPQTPYTISLFIPTASMIHSTQIMDMVNVPNTTGEVVIATSFGLSTYNGTWSTRHMTLDNQSEGILDDYVTAVEYDPSGNLWIGYPEGLQIYDGRYYQTIRDQQLLKNLGINDILRWNNDMWIATGHAGIHRFRDGSWTWYQPDSRGGPGFFEADSMDLDPVANATFIATPDEGLWMIPSQEDPVRFVCIAGRDAPNGLLGHVRRNPAGGVYFFNNSQVVQYSPSTGFVPVLTSNDLAITSPAINEISASNNGKLFLATDRGIYVWENGKIYRHLDRFEGIGTSSAVLFIYVDRSSSPDSQDRVWFSTQDNVGLYRDRSESPGLIPVITATPSQTPSLSGDNTSVPAPSAPLPPVMTLAPSPAPTVRPEGFGAIVDPLVQAIRSLFSGFGIRI